MSKLIVYFVIQNILTKETKYSTKHTFSVLDEHSQALIQAQRVSLLLDHPFHRIFSVIENEVKL